MANRFFFGFFGFHCVTGGKMSSVTTAGVPMSVDARAATASRGRSLFLSSRAAPPPDDQKRGICHTPQERSFVPITGLDFLHGDHVLDSHRTRVPATERVAREAVPGRGCALPARPAAALPPSGRKLAVQLVGSSNDDVSMTQSRSLTLTREKRKLSLSLLIYLRLLKRFQIS